MRPFHTFHNHFVPYREQSTCIFLLLKFHQYVDCIRFSCFFIHIIKPQTVNCFNILWWLFQMTWGAQSIIFQYNWVQCAQRSAWELYVVSRNLSCAMNWKENFILYINLYSFIQYTVLYMYVYMYTHVYVCIDKAAFTVRNHILCYLLYVAWHW